MATDPICGMYVDEQSAELRLARGNRTYYFCSTHCFQEFAQPERELRRLRHRLAIAWPLSIVVLVLTYGVHPAGWPWIALVLATAVQFYPGWQFYRSTYDALRNRNWNMDVLIAVGTTVAYSYSSAVLVFAGKLSPAYYFDASTLIVTLILSGNYLEHLTRERARGAIRALHDLLPSVALVLRSGGEVEVPVAEVHEGDLLRVRPGGRFPSDGQIVEGRSSVNESLLTGESLPVDKGTGDSVIAGAVNGDGALVVRATKVGEDTVLAQIGQLVTEAETSRVPLQRQADRIAAVFVPVVLALGLIAALSWFFGGVGITIALLVFVSVVITACPCAFGIATPAAIVVGTGRAAEEGILFKGRDSLERASRANLVLSDKTGTLTMGQPRLTDVWARSGYTEESLLSIAAGLESVSEHPFAKAVLAAAMSRHVNPQPARETRTEPGRGVRGMVEGRPAAVLQVRAAQEAGIDLSELSPEIRRLASEGKAVSVVLVGTTPAGLLAFSDTPRPGIDGAVRALAHDGIEVVMVTGDNAAAARKVAETAGIHDVRADVTPEGKLAVLRELQSRGKQVAFVGDGINDAPALAASDLGIAIGAGTEVAKEAGGVILTRSDFRGVALALRLGRRTVQKVRGNLIWAIGYNAILLPIAVGALVPFFGFGVYSILPMTGALAMGLSSTLVVLNSFSLRWVSLQ